MRYIIFLLYETSLEIIHTTFLDVLYGLVAGRGEINKRTKQPSEKRKEGKLERAFKVTEMRDESCFFWYISAWRWETTTGKARNIDGNSVECKQKEFESRGRECYDLWHPYRNLFDFDSTTRLGKEKKNKSGGEMDLFKDLVICPL